MIFIIQGLKYNLLGFPDSELASCQTNTADTIKQQFVKVFNGPGRSTESSLKAMQPHTPCTYRETPSTPSRDSERGA